MSDIFVIDYFAGTLTNTLLFVLLPLIVYVLYYSKWTSTLPGPIPWPLLGNLPSLGFLPYRKLAKLSEKYGPLMRLYFGSQFAVIVSSAEVAQEVLQKNDRFSASRMSTVTGKIFSNGERDVILTPYGPYWRKVRKLVNLLFAQKRLQSWLPMRIESIRRVANTFFEEAAYNNGVVEVRRILNQASLNIVMAMVAGKLYNFSSSKEESAEGDQVMNLVQQVLDSMAEINLSDYIPLLSPLDLQGVEKRALIVKQKFESYSTFLIQKRLELRESTKNSEQQYDSKDFLDVLLDSTEQGELTIVDVGAIVQDMLLAGVESSSLLTEWALAELITHPMYQNNLRNELNDVEISPETDFSKLPYLQAVIKETYRHHNSLPLLVPRKTSEEITIRGHRIPPNSAIFINAWAISHDPKTWTDPMVFRPERFLKENVDFRGHDFRFIPFGAGRRICPGMNLGHGTMELMLSILIKRFVWELPLGQHEVNLNDKFKLSMVMEKPLWAHIREV